MPAASVGDVSICYETDGDPAGRPLLLVMGLGAQLTAWHPHFVAALVRRGFYVIRFDNRDVGRSTWFDEAGPADPVAAFAGNAKPAYLLSDMAADTVGVLDSLSIASAHVVGVSMGGMIVQAMAIEYPARVRTMTSIMSTTGDPAVGQPKPDAIAALLRPPPASRDKAVEQSVEVWKVIGSPGFAFDEARTRARAAEDWDRAFHPEGTARQLVAIVCSGDRTPKLRELVMPTLVVHGQADPLVDPSGGKATADAVPDAQLKVIPGMGHDLPPEVFDEVTDAIAALAAKAAE